ncbi:MAG: arylesterase [Legionella sp.]|nr:arylesterase [Legionella sp.]
MRSLLIFLSIFVSSVTFASKNILIIGDSLSAGYGVEENKAWTYQIKANLSKAHAEYSLINASISGETTNGGLSRLPELLQKYKPAVLIIELGANDGLQGLPLEQTEKNLQKMIVLGKKVQAKILLVGIRIPTNYGPAYTNNFAAIYPRLAQQEHIALLPNLLAGVDENAELFQDDGLHPNQQAQPIISTNVWNKLSPLLE